MTERLFFQPEEAGSAQPDNTSSMAAWPVHPGLAPHVSQVLLYREAFPTGERVVERVIPDGSVRVVINLGDAPRVSGQRSEALELVGASASPALVELGGAMHGLSITLRPGAVAGLLGLPAAELSGRAVALAELWRGAAAELSERLARAKGDKQRQGIVTSVLLRRMADVDEAPHRTALRAVQLLSGSDGRLGVREVAEAVGVGERRLQQLFQVHVGLSPRTWRRLARMRGLLRTLRHASGSPWADVALDSGFYDQSHLVNELRALTGMTPSELMASGISHSSKTAG